MAFFAIFKHVTNNPISASLGTDLGLLKAAVSYFRNMKQELVSSSSLITRLEQTAAVFHNLASFVVEHSHTLDRTRPDKTSSASGTQTSINESQNGLETAAFDVFSYSDQFHAFLDFQDETETASEGVNVQEILDCLQHDATGDSRGHKRSFGSAFDWFSWDAAQFGSDPSL